MKKTISEWFEELPADIEAMARRNAEEHSVCDVTTYKCGSLYNAIVYAFVWHDTPEGAAFWAEVSRGHYGDAPEPVDVVLAMRQMQYVGGGFAFALSNAWYLADSDNRARIEKAFADLILRYWKEAS